jgi:hypothetical protein
LLEVTLICLAIGAVGTWLYLNVIATFVAVADPGNTRLQKTSKVLLIWLAPYIGASFVLRLAAEYAPVLTEKVWLPPYFRATVKGKQFGGVKPDPDKNMHGEGNGGYEGGCGSSD